MPRISDRTGGEDLPPSCHGFYGIWVVNFRGSGLFRPFQSSGPSAVVPCDVPVHHFAPDPACRCSANGDNLSGGRTGEIGDGPAKTMAHTPLVESVRWRPALSASGFATHQSCRVACHFGTSGDLHAIHDDAAHFAQNYFQRTNARSKMLCLPHQK